MNTLHKIYITVIGGILVIATILIYHAYSSLLEIKEQENLARLKGIANVLSIAVDAESLDSLLTNFTKKDEIATSTQNEWYQSLHQLFAAAEQQNDLKTPIYTLTKTQAGDAFLFGITSSKSPYYRHIYTKFPPVLMERYEEGGVIPQYGDEHGTWISAFAPIKTKAGKTLAVIQVDKHFQDFQKEAREEVLQELSFTAIITGIIILVLWGTLRTLIHNEEKYTHKLTETVKLRTKEVSEQKLRVEALLRKEQDYSQELLASQEELRQQTEELSTTNDQLKLTQKQLVQNEKMTSLGQMTSGIAHEINNPLNFISGGVQSIRINMTEVIQIIDAYEKMNSCATLAEKEQVITAVEALKAEFDFQELKTDLLHLLDDVELGTERVTNIIKSLKNFSVMEEDERQLTNIHELIDGTLMILNTKIKDKVVVKRDYDEAIQQVSCYPAQLNEVFLHLIENAVDAVGEESGIIEIQTKKQGENAHIVIRDNGTGIPPEIQSKIFDPFFTTKDIGKGTGLGLSVSYGIIEKHQGTIQLESELNQGTTFSISIPILLEEEA